MKCHNCGKKLSCGCQRHEAKDGKSCCNYCISKYNKNLPRATNTEVNNNSPKTNVSAYFTMKK